MKKTECVCVCVYYKAHTISGLPVWMKKCHLLCSVHLTKQDQIRPTRLGSDWLPGAPPVGKHSLKWQGRNLDLASYLPVAEHQLWAGQATGPFPNLIGKAKALSHGQHGLDDEHVCPLFHLLLQHSSFSLWQDCVDPTCKAAHLLNSSTDYMSWAALRCNCSYTLLTLY